MKDKNPARPPSFRAFRQTILTYYRDHGRDLAWRRTTDPYAILVSEIMLQQTQVERVREKFPVFLAAFPDFPSLARAQLPDILPVWQGMGYNRRALFLRDCARRVTGEYHGRLPQDPDTLATFPGIGRTTAASICAFAFNMPVIFIETNIRRVFLHFFFSGKSAVSDAEIHPLVQRTLYTKDPRTWYNALMDYGAYLKTITENPNRRSRHYTKQGSFAGSDREIRGSVLRILVSENDMTERRMMLRIPAEPGRIKRILDDLEREGFVTRSGSRLCVAVETVIQDGE